MIKKGKVSPKKVFKKSTKKVESTENVDLGAKSLAATIDETSTVEASGDLGKLGGKAILSIRKVMIAGKEYNSISLSDLTTQVLSDKDLEAQITK